jgi:hypothetical protein
MELTMSDQGQTAPQGVDLAAAYLAMIAEVKELKAANAKLKARQGGKLSCKVTDKGGVSVYGMGKWPVTLYLGQWERLLAAKEEIEAFLEANRAKLSIKE